MRPIHVCKAAGADDAPLAAAPGAKPLAWVKEADDESVESATTPFGAYNLQVFPKGCRVDFLFGSSGRRVFEVIGSTRDQGAAAAQADFAMRVLGCMGGPSAQTDSQTLFAASEPSSDIQTPSKRRGGP